MANRVLQFFIEAKDGASAVFKKVEDAAGGFSLKLGGVAKAVAGLAAGAALGKFFKDSIEEGAQAERSMARLGQAVANAGGNFKALTPALQTAVDGVRRLSTFSGGELTDALTNMVTITGDVAGSTENLGLAADLAAARNIDLAQASDIVAKAMNGNTTALNKLGIAGKDSESALKNLRETVGGFAATDAKTFDGALKNLNNSWKDFQENVGKAILGGGQAQGMAGKLSEALANLAAWVEANQDEIGKFVDVLFKLGDVVVKVLVGAFKLLRPVIDLTVTALGYLLEGIGILVEKGGALLRKLGVNIDVGLAESLKEAGKSLRGLAEATDKSEKAQTTIVKTETVKRTRQTQAELDKQLKAKKDEADKAKKLAEKHADDIQRIIDQQFTGIIPKVKDTAGAIENLSPPTQKFIDKLQALTNPAGPLEKLKAAPSTFPTSNALQQMAADADAAKAKAAGLVNTIQDNASAAVNFANGLGLISDSAAAALNSVIGLGSAIADIFVSGGNPLASLPAIIGGLAGVIGSLFGDSPTTRAREELLRKNNEVLADLVKVNGDLLKVNQPGAKIATVGAAIGQFLGPETKGIPETVAVKEDMFAAFLKDFGLTIKDLEEVASGIGLELRDPESGRISVGALRQLFQGIGMLDSGFADTFEGDLERIGEYIKAGILDSSQEFAAMFAAGLERSPIFAERLAGINPFTAEGRQDAIGVFQQLLKDFDAGLIKPEDLGGLTAQQFIDFITNSIGALSGDGELKPLTGTELPIGQKDRPPIEVSLAGDAPEGESNAPSISLSMGEQVSISGDILAATQAGNEHLAAIEALLAGLGQSPIPVLDPFQPNQPTLDGLAPPDIGPIGFDGFGIPQISVDTTGLRDALVPALETLEDEKPQYNFDEGFGGVQDVGEKQVQAINDLKSAMVAVANRPPVVVIQPNPTQPMDENLGTQYNYWQTWRGETPS